MARIRTIKPEFWTNAQIIECSTNARLLFIGLWNFCDDEGRHVFSAKQIKAQIFPSDDFSTENIHRMLDELSSNDLIVVYAIDNIEYLQVTGWRHQKIDKPYKSKIPPPNDQYLRSVGECSENVRLKERKGKEESYIRIETPTSESKTKTRTLTMNSSNPCLTRSRNIEFDRVFWPAYPHKVGKGAAQTAFERAHRRANLTAIMAGLMRYITTKPDDREWCNPATWLNQDRWLDEPAAVNGRRVPVANDRNVYLDSASAEIAIDRIFTAKERQQELEQRRLEAKNSKPDQGISQALPPGPKGAG